MNVYPDHAEFETGYEHGLPQVVWTTLVADLETPVSAYLKLAPFRPRFLLESVEGGNRLGRYSFLGFGDAVDVRLDQDGFHIGAETHPRPQDRTELLALMRKALDQAPQLAPDSAGLPFTGGLVGASSYDLVRLFERVPSGHPATGECEAHWLLPSSLLVFDHLTRRVALFHDGSDEERQAIRQDVMRALRAGVPVSRRGGFSTPRAGMEAERFHAAVANAKGNITARNTSRSPRPRRCW